MSELIERFLRAASGNALPLGFRTTRSAVPIPKLLLVAGLTGAMPAKPDEYISGAEAVLVRPAEAPGEKTLKKIADSLGGIPWGLYLEDMSNGLIEKAVDPGPDFLVFSAAVPFAAVPRDKKIGKILEVESAMDDSLLRAVNELPVDAVLLADETENGPLLWHQLMIFQHLAHIFPKPLIVPTPMGYSPDEFKALWEAGVDGILVAVDVEKPGRLREIRQAIDALPPRTLRKRGRVEVVLPRPAGESRPAPPDEEEEEED